MNTRSVVSFLLLLGSAAAISAELRAETRDYPAVARLDNGAYVGFTMLRTGNASSGGNIGEVVFPRSNGVSRVLYDQEGGSYFGYRLEVEFLQPVSYRFVFKPLAGNVDAQLQRYMHCPTCPRPTLLPGSMPRFPAPLTVLDGAVCTVDLLVNPQTGEKIIDVIKVSSQEIARSHLSAATDRIRGGLKLAQAGDTLVARGRLSGAIEEYLKALEINPNDAVVHNKLGICYQRQGDVDRALKQFELAVSLNPRFAEAWNNVGSCYHARGKLKQAVKYYQKALESKPGLATAYRNIGSAYFAQGRFEQGYEALQAAFRIDPAILETASSPGIQARDINAAAQYFYFAKLSAANGQIDTALDFLKKAVIRGFKDWSSVARDPEFAKVILDPRYKQLIQVP